MVHMDMLIVALVWGIGIPLSYFFAFKNGLDDTVYSTSEKWFISIFWPALLPVWIVAKIIEAIKK